MRVVIQRVSEACVSIGGETVSSIGPGLLVLLGIEHDDGQEDACWLAAKIAAMRIFSNGEGKMNLAVMDVPGEVLVVSQFTLHASTKKGNRPSFIRAARPDHAIPLYEYFVRSLQGQIGGGRVKTGQFGAEMGISLCNDGPVTIVMDSRNRE